MPSKRIELSKITLVHATPSLPNEAKGNDDKKIHTFRMTNEIDCSTDEVES